MSRLGTALERRREAPPSERPGRPLEALGGRLSGALQRREDAAAVARPRRRSGGVATPLAERLAATLERQLARAVARRLGGGSTDRTTGALEQRIVAAIERGLAGGRGPDRGRAGGLGRIGGGLQRRRRGGDLPATNRTTLRALAVSILARGIVRAIALFVRVVSRALVSVPMRRLAGLLARRAIRARPSRQAGLLGFLLGGIALLLRRLASLPRGRWPVLMVLLDLSRRLLPMLRRLIGWLLRAQSRLLWRQLRRATTRRRRD